MRLQRSPAVLVCTLLLAAASPAQRAPLALTQKLTVDQYHLTVQHPATWTAVQQNGRVWIANTPPERVAAKVPDSVAQIRIQVETRANHADALHRLQQIASEYEAPVTYLSVGGWPAMQRSVVIDKEQPTKEEFELEAPVKILVITTAVAAGNLLVRSDGRMLPDAPQATQQETTSIAAGMTFASSPNPADTEAELRQLRANPKILPSQPPRFRAGPAITPQAATTYHSRVGVLTPVQPPTTGARNVLSGAEPEIAASTDGTKVVVAQQFSYASSIDGGKTFGPLTAYSDSGNGDSSLAYGQSGWFYEATITIPSDLLNVSKDGGQTFAMQSTAYTCPATGMNACPYPDQEHIAADRYSAAANGNDQVYLVWRNLNGNYGIVCSTDSGQTFGTAQFTTGDFPRVTVGSDGSVYVIYFNGSNVTLDKYSSCSSSPSLAKQTSFPSTVATGIAVSCPMPGLDRCFGATDPGNAMVAVDDRPLHSDHVYVVYAVSTAPCGATAAQAKCNEDIRVVDSFDGGKTFGTPTVVNSAVTARRFLPWICSSGGNAWVSWYDRRAANLSGAKTNDLTDYYLGSVLESPQSSTSEVNLSNNPDPECASGWPNDTRAVADASSCTIQPQLAGICSPAAAIRCNLASPTQCPAGSACILGLGTPKYGDYNGNACAAGNIYTVWASAAVPSGVTPPPASPINLYFAVTDTSPAGCGVECQVAQTLATQCTSICSDLNTVAAKYHVCLQEAAAKKGQCYNDCVSHNPDFISLANCSQKQAVALQECQLSCGPNLSSTSASCQQCLSAASAVFNDPQCMPPPGTPPASCFAQGGTQPGNSNPVGEGLGCVPGSTEHPCKAADQLQPK